MSPDERGLTEEGRSLAASRREPGDGIAGTPTCLPAHLFPANTVATGKTRCVTPSPPTAFTLQE
ncbi:hypothetical protein MVI01_38720 [Myxococcus virescens]|uniref:Uncharacterized protein n=1 Tax=Myxococcus virescens TaxID=83456 RepID=A0A511HEV1_9BACT|nr:hypothetical protein MVI01_38720 [Myxococcus virescens]